MERCDFRVIKKKSCNLYKYFKELKKIKESLINSSKTYFYNER